MSEKLYVKIYKTTNNNYRAEVALTSGWTHVVDAPVKMHPLLAGCETLEVLFARISILYPSYDMPDNDALESVKGIIRNEGKVLAVCQEAAAYQTPVTTLDVRTIKVLTALMCSIDAYAADYAAEGKLASSRQAVVTQLGQCLTESPNSVDYQTYLSESLLRRHHFIALREVLAYAKETGTDWMCLVDAQQSVDADTFGED